MTSDSVVFGPEADDQLEDLYLYIAAQATPNMAERYTTAVVAYCEGLSTFPHRGVRRDDIRPGLRITNDKGRTAIAFAVDDVAWQVAILGLFHGGRDYETSLRPSHDD